MIKVTKRTHPGFSGLWIWWQCSSVLLQVASCLRSSPALLLFFHPNCSLSIANQCYVHFLALLCVPCVWMRVRACSQFKPGCSGSGCAYSTGIRFCLQHFHGLTGNSEGEGNVFESLSPCFSLLISKEVCPDPFARQRLYRSTGGQAVDFPY